MVTAAKTYTDFCIFKQTTKPYYDISIDAFWNQNCWIFYISGQIFRESKHSKTQFVSYFLKNSKHLKNPFCLKLQKNRDCKFYNSECLDFQKILFVIAKNTRLELQKNLRTVLLLDKHYFGPLHNYILGAPPLGLVQVWKIIFPHQIIVQTWNFLYMTQTLVRINGIFFFHFFHYNKIAEKV